METSPTLDEPWNWSEELSAFIAACLTRAVADRPTAAELLQVHARHTTHDTGAVNDERCGRQHPFLATVPAGWKMEKLIKRLRAAGATKSSGRERVRCHNLAAGTRSCGFAHATPTHTHTHTYTYTHTHTHTNDVVQRTVANGGNAAI
jgi:hypothetical protein